MPYTFPCPACRNSEADAAEIEAEAAAAEARAMQQVYNLARTNPAAAEQRLAGLLSNEPDAAAAWFVWAQLAAAGRRFWMARDLYRWAQGPGCLIVVHHVHRRLYLRGLA